MRRSWKLTGILLAALASSTACDRGNDGAQRQGASIEAEDCTLTQGYWKTHPEDWSTTSLTLGSNSYTTAELQAILDEPVAGNGLIALAHQLIAAKLNILIAGADDSTIASTIADADAL